MMECVNTRVYRQKDAITLSPAACDWWIADGRISAIGQRAITKDEYDEGNIGCLCIFYEQPSYMTHSTISFSISLGVGNSLV